MSEKVSDVQSRLEEIDRRVMEGLTPFQRATVEHIAAIYSDKERVQKRVLVADEVGLGKTLIARGVVSKMAKLRSREGDDLVKIAYICSNGAIAAQNVAKLAIDGDVKLAPPDASRLSMQHLAIANERGDTNLKRSYIQITPLTPSTSFSLTTGAGTMYERSLMLAVLLYDARFNAASGRSDALADMMWSYEKGFSASNWESWRSYASKEVRSARAKDPSAGYQSGYPFDVAEKVSEELDRDGGTTLDDIAAYLDGGTREKSAERKMIIDLRRAFSKACVDMLEPDFVIMDEFQRFRELIADSESETAMLAKRFFSGDTRVLLLSATPFRLFSTAAELDAGGFGDSYREFLEVMEFLNEGNAAMGEEFEEMWGAYTLSLQKLGSGACDVVSIRHTKSQAETAVRKAMARTERQSTGELGPIADNRTHVRELGVSASDVRAYMRMREVADEAGIARGLVQVDYAKSCPFPLSFMSRYKLWDKLKGEVRKRPGLMKADKKYDDGLLWLRRWDVASYSKIKMGNARYQAFLRDLDGQAGSKIEQLLWVPPSRPYYRPPQTSPFARAEGFSKFLVFSAWSMVPPALASLLSYEFERRNVRALEAITGRTYRYFKDGEAEEADENRDEQALPYRRLRFDLEQRNAFLLLYPSRYLASLIDVSWLANGNMTLNELRLYLRKRIAEDLMEALGVRRLPTRSEASTRRTMDWYIMAAMKLDQVHGHDVIGELLGDSRGGYSMREKYGVESRVLGSIADEFVDWDPRDLAGYPVDLVRVLADAAIGSAAVCAMRCYQGIYADASAKLAFEFGHAFMNRMNTASSTLAVAAAMEERDKRTIHWKNLLAYGCEGNMQAMVDEYAHVCRPVHVELGKEDAVLKTHQAMVGKDDDNPSCYLAETRHGVIVPNNGHANERIGSMSMRTNIASAFMKSSSGKADKNVISRVRLRNAFNSPFRPFVLVSTSVGQEGLDFHSYCRKICHWNLPSNPIDLEQREGRVNRYKGLAVRQNVAARYGGIEFDEGSVWEQLFSKAEVDEQAACKAVCENVSAGASGLLPYWGVSESDDMVKVERYVYLYPFSRDGARYDRLVADVFRYRAVMGMPDQEELLHMLEAHIASGDLSEEDLRGLFVNLCPYTWLREKE